MSSSDFIRVGATVPDVPNVSMSYPAEGGMPPNNSMCCPPTQSFPAAGGSTMSDERLSDRLIQVALYDQFDSPPSALGGDKGPAQSAFNDIDFGSNGKIPFRHILKLIRSEDMEICCNYAEPTAMLGFEEFVAFVEHVSATARA